MIKSKNLVQSEKIVQSDNLPPPAAASTTTPSIDSYKGDILYATVFNAFIKTRCEDGRIKTLELADAALTVTPVYDSVFGQGMVSNQLKKDIEKSTQKVREACWRSPHKSETVDSFIKNELELYNIDKIRKDSTSGVRNLLWMKRSLDFIVEFLEKVIVTMKEKSAKECASETYNAILKPYHGILVSNIVTMAFNLCPSRRQLCHKLGYSDDEIVEDRVKKLAQLMKPIIAEVSKIINEAGCNFPDKV